MLDSKTNLSDKTLIDYQTKLFFNIFTNINNRQPDWDLIYKTCIPETLIIKKNGNEETIYNLESFIEPRKIILSDATLTDFEENEINEETRIIGNIAQRFSRYQKTGFLNGNYFKDNGNKFFQFIKTNDGWKINSLIWEDDKL